MLHAVSAPSIGRARAAVASAFLAQGLVFITLTTRLPQMKQKWEIGEAGLSLLLLMMVLLAGVGSVLAETLAGRRASAGVLRGGLVLVALALPVVVSAPSFPVFVAALAAYGVGLGVVDAAGNMQAVAVEHAAGRPLLPSFHGAWTFGGLLGAGLTLAVPGLGPAAAVTVVPLLAAGAPLLPRSAQGQQHEAVRSDVEIPWRQIVLVGLGMVVFYMVDTAATTWGPTYLDLAFATPDRAVALATFPYLLATLAMRLAGDGLVARIGPVPVLRVGGVVAAGALVVVVLAPTWVVAVVGFTVLGAGVAVIAPLSYSAAARIAGGTEVPAHLRRARVDAVIGRFNQFNYVGALLGAVLTGLVGAHDLRFGFAVPMVLVLAILPLARAFR